MRDVLSGTLDAAIVQGGWFESNQAGQMDQFRFHNLKNTSFLGETYPFATSTDIIPNYGLAAGPHVSWQLRENVLLALSALNASSPMSRTAGISKFTTAASYETAQLLAIDSGIMFRNGPTFDCLNQAPLASLRAAPRTSRFRGASRAAAQSD
jgi:hypothetical protein